MGKWFKIPYWRLRRLVNYIQEKRPEKDGFYTGLGLGAGLGLGGGE